EKGWAFKAISSELGIPVASAVCSQMNPDAEVVDAMPEGWLPLYGATRQIGCARSLLPTLAAANQLRIHVFHGHRIVNLQEAKRAVAIVMRERAKRRRQKLEVA